MSVRVRSDSEASTEAYGESFGRRLAGGETVLLCGGLGVGKTCFARGVGRALGVRGPVVSPSFTLAVQYEGGRLPLVHYDLYRVVDARELLEMGFLDTDDPRTVCLVEWGDRTDPPPGAIHVRIELGPDGSRQIEIRGPGSSDTAGAVSEGQG